MDIIESKRYGFAGWFAELPSGMSYRLWEQGGHAQGPGEVALYAVPQDQADTIAGLRAERDALAAQVAKMRDADILARYSRDDARREWVNVGVWLLPGDVVAHMDGDAIAAPQTVAAFSAAPQGSAPPREDDKEAMRAVSLSSLRGIAQLPPGSTSESIVERARESWGGAAPVQERARTAVLPRRAMNDGEG